MVFFWFYLFVWAICSVKNWVVPSIRKMEQEGFESFSGDLLEGAPLFLVIALGAMFWPIHFVALAMNMFPRRVERCEHCEGLVKVVQQEIQKAYDAGYKIGRGLADVADPDGH